MIRFHYNNGFLSTVTDDKRGIDHMGAVFFIESGRLGRDKGVVPSLSLLLF